MVQCRGTVCQGEGLLIPRREASNRVVEAWSWCSPLSSKGDVGGHGGSSILLLRRSQQRLLIGQKSLLLLLLCRGARLGDRRKWWPRAGPHMNGPRPRIEDGRPGPHGSALAALAASLTAACSAAVLAAGGRRAIALPPVATALTAVVRRGLLRGAPRARATAPANPYVRRENRNFAIVVSGIRSNTIKIMGFIQVPL